MKTDEIRLDQVEVRIRRLCSERMDCSMGATSELNSLVEVCHDMLDTYTNELGAYLKKDTLNEIGDITIALNMTYLDLGVLLIRERLIRNALEKEVLTNVKTKFKDDNYGKDLDQVRKDVLALLKKTKNIVTKVGVNLKEKNKAHF